MFINSIEIKIAKKNNSSYHCKRLHYLKSLQFGIKIVNLKCNIKMLK